MYNLKYNCLLILAFFILFMGTAEARDFGVIGETYSIAEPDLMQILKKRLSDFEVSGKFTSFNKTFQSNMLKKMDRPEPVAGLKTTLIPRTYFFDPSVVIKENILDSTGKIIIPAGTVINPLNQTALSETLVFYNADSREQAEWAKNINEKLKGNDKLILVGGSVQSEEKRLQKIVYFDQSGRMTTHFTIQQTPAIITQEGQRLKIQEVRP